ncbi:hypothetical protein LMH87_002288 [Akanthomyces muscarius]|uniref:holo-[acyl-carrier-protein] synthase n=1 Tax=Akanthomyces muscarius TaxID=2231603 RepID=A0A9W8Q879_AKAMU|nr:hypothetical protein LMH87_002288 [Akanthomyces muscarius]KAJ4147783.1 hypothetical protein LMH87_002288 [Akanthomyces muscarius]
MAKVLQWVLDTRKLWPEASKTAELEHVAARAMDLLLDSERAAVLRYYHVRDAKLALGSALLKRLLIAQHTPGLAWDAATAVRDPHTKPVFYHPAGSQHQPLLFNVSHQAGLVVVLAAYGAPEGTQVGVDVVCAGERRVRDLESIQADGWSKYVDMHDSVLSPVEARRLRELPPVVEAGAYTSAAVADKKLAYFYTLWCLREAYVKMTGEALLASWLGDLEMRGFAPPGETREGGGGGLEVFFGSAGGKRVTDVDLRIEWFLGKEYMISTSVRNPHPSAPLPQGKFELLNLDAILRQAEELKATR